LSYYYVSIKEQQEAYLDAVDGVEGHPADHEEEDDNAQFLCGLGLSSFFMHNVAHHLC
jgi:hypothetical protein